MTNAKFKEVNPILPVPDVEAAVRYYTERLGFRVSFRDRTGPSDYVGVRRDGVELHLQWHEAKDIGPKGTLMLRFIVDDPDAPGGTFTHWIAVDIRPDVLALPENVDLGAFGGAAGMNDFKRIGYAGPCPPKLEIHHYFFRVFALNAPLGPAAAASRSAIDAALSGHVLAEGTLVGTFSR